MRLTILAAATVALFGGGLAIAAPYRVITPQAPVPADQVVTLTGHDLTVEQLVAVARYGQPVEVSPDATRHQEDAHGLLLEGAAEGVPIAGFNRGGVNNQTVLFDGDPTTPEIAATLLQRAAAAFQGAAVPAGGTEIADEEVVRAMMVVRANTLTYAPVSAPVTQMLADFLNNRITPVAAPGQHSLDGIAAAMVGKGDAYYHGIRVTAAQALSQAGLTPLAPIDADFLAFTDSGAYAIGRSALLVADGRRALEWSDLIFAMDLNGMNAGIGPLSLPAQANRPHQWIYWDAGRVLDMIKGSYLFDEPTIDAPVLPDALAASPTRQGAAWRAWGELRDVLLVALNSSDETLAARVGLSPHESPELGTPRLQRYFVKGGKNSGGKRGFIVPTVNDDPFPLANNVAAFTHALEILDSAIGQRVASALAYIPPKDESGLVPVNYGRQHLDATFALLATDLTKAATLLDQRQAENTARTFGPAPTAVWTAFRTAVPARMAGDTAQAGAAQFIQANQPGIFYPKGEPPPGTDDPIPLAQEKIRR